MAAQIELSIGPQLQKIRINGTLVGGAIGLLLFVAGGGGEEGVGVGLRPSRVGVRPAALTADLPVRRSAL